MLARPPVTRLIAVKAVLAGHTRGDVASALQISRSTLDRWLRMYHQGGLEAVGRPRKGVKEAEIAPRLG